MMEYKKNCLPWKGQSQSNSEVHVVNDRVLHLLHLLAYWTYSHHTHTHYTLVVCRATLPFSYICWFLAMTWMSPQMFPTCFSSFSTTCCHVIFGLDITKLCCSRKYSVYWYTPNRTFFFYIILPTNPLPHQTIWKFKFSFVVTQDLLPSTFEWKQ